MQPVYLNDQLVAAAEVDGGVLIGRVVEQDERHPERRFVTFMLRYAVASVQGKLPERYRDERAELFARTCLMPDTVFDEHHLDRDEELAARFNVPVDQVLKKRGDLVTWWDRPTIPL